MIYKKIAPSVLLKPFVETFYVWETSINQDIISKIESPPSGFASMVFNYGEAYKVNNDKKGEITVPASFLTGQATKKYQLSLAGNLGMIGIVFKPSALFTLLGIPMYEFNDERINLTDVLGIDADRLVQQIGDSVSQRQRIAMVSDNDAIECKVLIFGTQKKDFLGLPAKGLRFESEHIFVFRFNDDDQIVDLTIDWDNAGFVAQLS